MSLPTLFWQVSPETGILEPILSDCSRNVAWAPQPGSQEAFLSCPVEEVLYTGTRGCGKSESLLMDFAQHVGTGLGADWHGLIFRKIYRELGDILQKAERWFSIMFPGFHLSKSPPHVGTFPTGEKLVFSHFERESDYWAYHGFEIPFIAWEELTTHASPSGYLMMMSCSRSRNPRVPIKYRATTNPYGVGHNWARQRFNLHKPRRGPLGDLISEHYVDPLGKAHQRYRIAIRGQLSENKVLLHSNPSYVQNIAAAAKNEAQLKAWLTDDWNIASGGMFDDVWDARYHILPQFHPRQIPRGWRVNRAYDHGQSKPFSVGWYAQSDGNPLELNGRRIGAVRGDLIRFHEWYGMRRGEENVGVRMASSRIAEGILGRESDWNLRRHVQLGPADSSIFDGDASDPERSPAKEFAAAGVHWLEGRKGPGSRVKKWELLRKLLANSIPINGYRESPGFFITENCEHALRLLPYAPTDDKNADDIDTDWEDHIVDEIGYRIYSDPDAPWMRGF